MNVRVSLCSLGLLLGLVSGEAFAHAVPHPDPGYTGAVRFSENSCVECHSGGSANSGPGNVKLTFNGQAVTTYTPGATVPVQIVITDTGGGRLIWGFELTARFASNTNAGTLAPRDNTTTTFRGDGVVSPVNVTYISHLNATIRPAATTFTYTINWTAPPAGSGQVIFNVAANAGNGDNTQFNDHIYTSGDVVLTEAAATTPAITSAGIVNAATFNTAPNNQVSRGQLISIFGSNLTAGGTSAAQAIPLPTSLGGTSVLVNGTAIPLIVVSAGQINAQLPSELGDTGTATLAVTSGGQTSTQATVNLQVTSPGIFSVNSNGAGDGAILNGSKGNALVTPANPAKAGDVVVIFCTGLGATKTLVPSGTAANGEPVIAATTVTIGGKDAPVQFAGLAPGFVGLYQVNAVVPSGVSGSVPVVINAGGLTSRTDVTMSVQ